MRLLPANRRTDPLLRPYMYVNGKTPLNVIRKAAGSPRDRSKHNKTYRSYDNIIHFYIYYGKRHMHYRNSRIQDYSQTLTDFIVSLKCSKLDADLKNKSKEHILFTLRFTS